MRSKSFILASVPGLLLSACGQGSNGNGAAAPGAEASGTIPAGRGGSEAADAPPLATGAPTANLAGRTREVGNPDDFTMVLLSYSLSGATPPIDKWIEGDTSVRFAQPIDREAARNALRQKIDAGLAAARDIGLIRLTMDADLSDFDPSYNEYTIRALAPSSMVTFRTFDEQVSVTFNNAEQAQRWSIDPRQAQLIRDKVQYGSGATIEMLLRISGSTPNGGAGTITTTVLSYELRSHRDGTTLARVTL